jgi:hypothetical protein
MKVELPVDLETLFTFVRKCRLERMKVNDVTALGQAGDPHDFATWYGAPTLQVIASNWDHIHDRPWDHSLESIRECAEIAILHQGWVTVEYPIVLADPECDGTGEEIDEGFEVQVFPRFALRTHNTFVEITSDEEE